VLERYPWIGAGSLTEDRDYGIYLVTQGVRIRFAPEAVSVGQAVTRWKDATPQRLRWYGGAFQLQRRYVRALASRVVRQRDLDALDKLLELSLPPFSLLVLGSVLVLIAQALLNWLGEQPVIWPVISIGLVGLAGLFPFLGLAATGAPRVDYSALLMGPLYVFWRAGIALHVRLRPGRIAWVRTRRVGD
jgi:cellulose synthase/poly-beta-1,6-N-acetylglucosamine synthase-like glycosyltransferase